MFYMVNNTKPFPEQGREFLEDFLSFRDSYGSLAADAFAAREYKKLAPTTRTYVRACWRNVVGDMRYLWW